MERISLPATGKTGYVIVVTQQRFQNKYFHLSDNTGPVWTFEFDNAFVFHSKFTALLMLRAIPLDKEIFHAGIGIGCSITSKTARVSLVALETESVIECYQLLMQS